MSCPNCGVERNTLDLGWYSSHASPKLTKLGIEESFCCSVCLDAYERKMVKKGKK